MKWSAVRHRLGLSLVLLLIMGGPGAHGAGGAAAEVGTKDPAFDAAPGNPCQGQGKGALADIQAMMGKGAQYWEAWWAANIAEQATKKTTLAQVHEAAHVVTLILTDATKMK